jgi:hypothetical protein
MDTNLEQLLSHVIGDMARAISERPGESQQQQFARAQAAVQSILAFQPADAIEAMIAGHCVMFHALIVDTVQTTLRGEPDTTRRARRNSIVAMDKAFGDNLIRLRRQRARQPESAVEAAPTDALAETEIADRITRHQSRPSEGRAPAASGQTPSTPEAARAIFDRSPDSPVPDFPRADSLDQPDEPYPTAAAPIAGPNRQARREIIRRSRKRGVPSTSGQAPARRPGVTPTHNASATRASATAAG